MFEYKIQEAWDQYKSDLGLGRILLFLAFYNLFLFFLSGIGFGGFMPSALWPVFIAFIFYFLRPNLINLSPKILFWFNAIPIAISTILNYYLVGEFDRAVGGIERRDAIFSDFDQTLFNGPASHVFEKTAELLGTTGALFYDLMMLSYISYFFLPLIGGILYFKTLGPRDQHKIGRYFFSVVLYFALNFILYLVVPVTGPQYWLSDTYTDPLPLTTFGHFFWSLVNQGQTTFIDCFPSGHTGIAFLVTIWLVRINHPLRFLLMATTAFIVMATLAMRYHYTMDLLCAFPLAYFCHRVAWVFIPVDVRPQKNRSQT
ncbi:MAG: phosphatase PAP2 family protein [Bacteriovoracaceae bacterium]|nr:phosphatase PAP2 family protein [Bacteriovoracaceae bacterium]